MGGILSSFFGGGPVEAAAQSAVPSQVLAIHSSERWQLHSNALKQTPQLMVIDFSATWCGPCRFMEPIFNDLSITFTDVNFVKIDVDELPDVAKEFGVQAMPTFVLVKKGKEEDRIVGAKKDELVNKIKKLSPISELL